MLKIDQLRHYGIFKGLEEDDLSTLAACITKRSYSKNSYIYHEGNPALNIYLIESGLVRLFFCNQEGEEFMLSLGRPSDTIGFAPAMGSQLRMLGAAALQPTVLLSIPRDDFQRMIKSSHQLALNLIQELSIMQTKLLIHYQSMVISSLEGRLALLLLHIGWGEKDELDLPISQADLASWLGVSRGRLNSALTRFQKKGLIQLEGPKLTILDRTRLTHLANGLSDLEK